METLIFIAIAVVITIIQKKLEKAKEQQNQLPLTKNSIAKMEKPMTIRRRPSTSPRVRCRI